MTPETTWTPSQYQRLKELDVASSILTTAYPNITKRDIAFQQMEKHHARQERQKLAVMLAGGGISQMDKLQQSLTTVLTDEGFLKVSTPTIISKQALAKMTIDQSHPLFQQVFWVSEKKCLRPMLAPNLYSLMRDFSRQQQRPVRFFEIGSCYRKESEGSRHASEFTMLNLVELGVPDEDRLARIQELASLVAEKAGLVSYSFENEDSAVYGTTVDLVAGQDNIEVASAAMGPHPLDEVWEIRESWIGMGFGLERLLMIASGDHSIGRWCKGLHYHDSIRLRV